MQKKIKYESASNIVRLVALLVVFSENPAILNAQVALLADASHVIGVDPANTLDAMLTAYL